MPAPAPRAPAAQDVGIMAKRQLREFIGGKEGGVGCFIAGSEGAGDGVARVGDEDHGVAVLREHAQEIRRSPR